MDQDEGWSLALDATEEPSAIHRGKAQAASARVAHHCATSQSSRADSALPSRSRR
jgi:hypothetical protein